MRPIIGVAVIGAGPYGLSVAAHLSALGLRPRVFGQTMETWRSFMPEGMVLKSEGFAMDLSDPDRRMTLGAFCAENGIPYRPVGWPVPVEIFAAYGAAFQKRFVPQVEETQVRSVTRTTEGFDLTLETGESLIARNVIMATGIRAFSHLPPELRDLPAGVATHSSDHGSMQRFAGQHVAVLGGGASAMDVAASLYRAGARATVVTRQARVRFYSPQSFRSMRDRLLAPMTALGPGWKKFLCVKAPGLFRWLPATMRRAIIRRYLGPSPAWSVHDIITNHVDVRVGSRVQAARFDGRQLSLTVEDGQAVAGPLQVDHVIAATGYVVDAARFPALDGPLRAALRCDGAIPVLSHSFETSEPGLFVIGAPAATSFGPAARFVCGAAYAARRVSRQIARRERSAARAKGRPATALVLEPHNSSVPV